MLNIDSNNGPELNLSSSKKKFNFNCSSVKTDSRRQIVCEPLKIENDFRLLCLQEKLKYAEDFGRN